MTTPLCRRHLLRLLGGVPLALSAAPLGAEGAERVASIGGAITEIVYALGEAGRLVARDTTSTFPPEAMALPDVGYIRRLSPEGVLSVNPSLILTQEGAGPPEAVALLREAHIELVEIPDGFDGDAVLAKIARVAEALGVPEKGAALSERVATALAEAEAQVAALGGTQRRVLFVLALQGGRIMAAGSDTAAEGIIRMAGGANAAEGFTGYKPLSDEAVIAAAPDVILMMHRSGDLATTDEALFGHPAILSTPAGEARAVLRIEGMKLLGFGPRTPEAATELARALAAL